MHKRKPIKRRLIDLRPRTYALLLIGWVLLWAILLGIAAVAFGQAPTPGNVPGVCLVSPAQIVNDDPAGRPVTAWIRGPGFPVQVDARAYLRQAQSGKSSPDVAAVIIQYSLTLRAHYPHAARETSIQAYVPEAPEVSLHAATWGYLWSGSPLQRQNLGYWLTRVVASPSCL